MQILFTGYYVDALEALGKCPLTVRGDGGTENVTVFRIQEYLRNEYSNSSRPSFLTGKSCQNQKIESWWSILRKQNAQFWIEFFSCLKDDGYFTNNFIDKNLIRFCFTSIIQVKLNIEIIA